MPLAIMDCGYITQMRTGAATGVSVKYLARADARVLGIVGAGAQARSQVAAVSHVRNLSKVKAFDIDPDATKRLLKEIADLGLEAEAVGSPEEACALLLVVRSSRGSGSGKGCTCPRWERICPARASCTPTSIGVQTSG
jgi:alanine dehydrogenase